MMKEIVLIVFLYLKVDVVILCWLGSEYLVFPLMHWLVFKVCYRLFVLLSSRYFASSGR